MSLLLSHLYAFAEADLPARIPCPSFHQHWFPVIVQSPNPVSLLTEMFWIICSSVILQHCENISHCVMFIWWYVSLTRPAFFFFFFRPWHTWSMMQMYGMPCHVQSPVLQLCPPPGSPSIKMHGDRQCCRADTEPVLIYFLKSKPFANIPTLIYGEP